MMKLYLSGSVSLLMLSHAMAATQVVRPHPVASGQTTAVPVYMDEVGPRPSGRLRDQVRQSLDGSSQTQVPYRLTPEERQRLREQLRQQSWSAQPSK